jgi:Mg-chelatase subunit ChlD
VQNQVGLVTFSNSATAACSFTSTYSTVSSKLSYYLTTNIYNDGIYDGGTNLSAGLTAAFNLFTSSSDGTPWNQIIIVFSDGEWNEGSDPLNLVSQATSAGITIDTIGLLSEGNNTTMQQLASQTGGQFINVTNTAAVKAAFQQLAESIPVLLTQ